MNVAADYKLINLVSSHVCRSILSIYVKLLQ